MYKNLFKNIRALLKFQQKLKELFFDPLFDNGVAPWHCPEVSHRSCSE